MTDISRIATYINSEKNEIIEFWKKIVNISSGSGNKTGVDKVAETVAEKMQELGITPEIIKMDVVGNALKGIWNPDAKGEPVVLMGHMDTVFNKETEEGKFRIEDGIAKGHGALDMKAGVVMALYICKALAEAGYDERPIKFVFAGDEEIAHGNADTKERMAEVIRGAKAAFNFETGNINNGIVTGRLGTELFRITVKGVSAHSGNDPEKGRSAIEEMSHKIVELQKITNIEEGKLFNVGTILTEGKTNIIPDTCVAEGAFRYKTNRDYAEMMEKIKEICNNSYVEGTSCVYEKTAAIGCMEPLPNNYKLFEFAKKIAAETGYGEVHPMEVGGGSDSSVATDENVPVICGIGVRGEFNHTMREYAVVDSMFERIIWIANVIARIDELEF